ncbi:Ig-like domain-containing protein [Temperatibacter marinus]|uniref:Ig-like domain-containing protein n=1 Tax=Temperatibacter marinus TaxID=1456591 RepID=A0AA52EHP5_9PROT|nr:Ig-like domain-containing protein [Temperatibacter marinus]WND02246.1 Ig-like domain-containing protein [Temperatibacter marinus]
MSIFKEVSGEQVSPKERSKEKSVSPLKSNVTQIALEPRLLFDGALLNTADHMAVTRDQNESAGYSENTQHLLQTNSRPEHAILDKSALISYAERQWEHVKSLTTDQPQEKGIIDLDTLTPPQESSGYDTVAKDGERVSLFNAENGFSFEYQQDVTSIRINYSNVHDGRDETVYNNFYDLRLSLGSGEKISWIGFWNGRLNTYILEDKGDHLSYYKEDGSALSIAEMDHIIRFIKYEHTGESGTEDVRRFSFSMVNAEGDEVSEQATATVNVLFTPALEISLEDLELTTGEVTQVRFTFTEDVGNSFQISDLIAENGKLSNLVQDAKDPKVYTAYFTPDANIKDFENSITLKENSVEDLSGDFVERTTSRDYSIDTEITASLDLDRSTSVADLADHHTDYSAGEQVSLFNVDHGYTIEHLNTIKTIRVDYSGLLNQGEEALYDTFNGLKLTLGEGNSIQWTSAWTGRLKTFVMEDKGGYLEISATDGSTMTTPEIAHVIRFLQYGHSGDVISHGERSFVFSFLDSDGVRRSNLATALVTA